MGRCFSYVLFSAVEEDVLIQVEIGTDEFHECVFTNCVKEKRGHLDEVGVALSLGWRETIFDVSFVERVDAAFLF